MSTQPTPIRYEDVAAAAQALQDSGRKPTILAVREQLGRGSFSTVKKYLDRWMQAVTEVPASASSVPPQLESLWQEARRAAELELASERAALAALSDELEQRLEDMQARVEAADDLRLVAETRLADKDAELNRVYGVLADLRNQRDHIQVELDAARAAAGAEREAAGRRLDQLNDSLSALGAPVQALGVALATLSAARQASERILRAELSELRGELCAAQAAAGAELAGRFEAGLEPLAGLAASLKGLARRAASAARPLPARASGRFRATRG